VQNLRQALNIHPILCRLLVQRGIKSFGDAKDFFRPDLSQLHDPFLMKDMDAAVERLARAINRKERILLYGDYDVDGTTAVAMMYAFLSKHHPNLDYYIPDRYKEGYGVSFAGIEYAHLNKTSLIIAMDCGIQAREQVSKARSLGIDFIICDHHLPEGKLPDAVAVLDPLREDCLYPCKGLSGCGVAFKLVQAYILKNDLPASEWEELLDFLVLSIAADIVPVTGENRTLAYFGLQKLNATQRPGLSALIEQSGKQRPLSISDVVFGLAPRINATGRLADAVSAVRLMLSNEKFVASDNARLLDHRNKLRKEYDQSIVKEAKELFESMPAWQDQRSIVLFQPHWHKGIVGIAAARMVEHFHKPSILLTESNGVAVGSARSVPGYNIYQAIKVCGDLLLNFGGHNHAAGMSLPVEAIPAFQERFEAAVRESLAEELRIPEIPISAVLELQDITPGFWRILKQFAPFGPGNRSPVFASQNVRDAGYSRLMAGNALRLAVKQGNSPIMYGVAFDRGEDFAKISSKKPFHICYKLEENTWQGETSIRMVVKDIKF
jgi:single-stranded-DNA-specific exonuclease